MSDKEIIQVLDRLMRECDIRDPARKNGYLSALLDVRTALENVSGEGSEYCAVMRQLKNLASTSFVAWDRLEEYAKRHPLCYPSDFLFEAREVINK